MRHVCSSVVEAMHTVLSILNLHSFGVFIPSSGPSVLDIPEALDEQLGAECIMLIVILVVTTVSP